MHQSIATAAVHLLRLGAWLILLMAVFVPLERLAALHPQKVFRPGFATDLTYYFVSSLVPGLALVPLATVLAWGLHALLPTGLHAWAAGLSLPARLAAALAVGEIGFYWGHRWSHEIPLLWRFHAVHHSAERMDWLVNTRAHPVDIIFTRLCGFVPIYVLGLARPVGHATDMAPMLVLLLGTVWGFFIHANLRWRLGWLGWLVATPAFHHWHHTNDAYRDRNYAAMLPVLDRIFGTSHVPRHQWPARYGTDSPMAAGFAGQMMAPVRRRWGTPSPGPAAADPS